MKRQFIKVRRTHVYLKDCKFLILCLRPRSRRVVTEYILELSDPIICPLTQYTSSVQASLTLNEVNYLPVTTEEEIRLKDSYSRWISETSPQDEKQIKNKVRVMSLCPQREEVLRGQVMTFRDIHCSVVLGHKEDRGYRMVTRTRISGLGRP